MKTLKKIVVLMISAIAIAIGLISINTKVSASDEHVFLKLERFRQPELNTPSTAEALSYKSLTEKVMWKICTTNSIGGETVDKYKTIYCIKAGPGFGDGNDMGGMDGDGVTKEYTKVFDLKNKSNIDQQYAQILPSGEAYNSLVWVLEHCYVPTSDASKMQEAKEFRDNLLREAERVVKAAGTEGVNIVNSGITDNEIDIVQQLAVWYFTNSDEYKVNEQATFSLQAKNATDLNYTPITDRYENGDKREDAAQDLLYYFIHEAKNAGTPVPSVNSSPVTLTSNNAKAIQYGTNYIIGPYTLTSNTNVEYSLELSQNVTLLDSGKSDVTASGIKNLVDKGNFYISVPSSTDLKSLTINITAKVNQTNLKYRSVENGSQNGVTEQPVVEVTREQSSFSTEVKIPDLLTGQISLKLIKVDKDDAQQKLGNATFTVTMPDNTKKTGITSVSDGSVSIDSFVVKEAKDYQFTIEETTSPTGYKSIGTITVTVTVSLEGNEYKVTNVTATGNGVTTQKDPNNVVSVTIPNEKITGEFSLQLLKIDNKNNDPLNGAKFQVEQLSSNGGVEKTYSDLTTQGNGTVVISNIKISSAMTYKFRITEVVVPDGYYNLINSLEIEVVTALRNNAEYIVQSTSITSGGVANAKTEVSGTSSVKVTIPNEKITGKFDLQLLKTDNTEAKKTLDGAIFKVESIGNGNESLGVYDSLTTANGGTVTVTDIPINGVGTYKYRITEVQAPAGYNKIIDSIIIDVVTKQQGNTYVVDSTSISPGGITNSYLKAEKISDTAIKVTIPNEKITGQFNLKLIKTDKDDGNNKLAGAVFKVTKPDTTEQTVTTTDDGSISIPNIEIPGEGTYTCTIKEINAPADYKKIIDEIQVQIITGVNGGKYVVNSTSITTTPNAVGIDIKVNDDTIELTIPNKKIEGHYNLQLIKVDNKNNNKLAGAKFKAEILGEGDRVEKTYNDLTTQADGTVNITEDIKLTKVGTYRVRITEEQAPADYNKIINSILLELTVVLNEEGDEYVVQSGRIVEEVANSNVEIEKYTNANVDLEGKLVKVTIPNEKITGNFDLKLIKTDKDNASKLAGAEFEVTMLDMTKQTVTTGQDGSISIPKIEIPGVGTYTYTIKETKAPTAYKKIIDEIQIEITTEVENGKYVVKSARVLTQNVDGVAVNVNNGTVEVTIPNKRIESTYQLEIVKVDYSNNTLKLPGAVFEVTMPDKTVRRITVGEDGTASIPSIKVNDNGTYTYTIKEVEAPKGYTLSNEIYTLTVRFELENDTYVIKEKTLTSSDASSRNATLLSVGNKIQITIKNKQFDLALRKFISQIGDEKYDRAPKVNTDNLNKVVDGSKVTTAEYVHQKNAIRVKKGDIITYTIRVYNEGEIDGYVSEVVDYIPEELEFIEDDELNLSYGWTYDESDVDEEGRVRRIRTDYTKQGGVLDVKSEARPYGTLLKAYNATVKALPYLDLQVRCIVRDTAIANKKITNIAEITGSTDSEGEEVEDRDSTEDSLTNDNSKPEDKNPEDNLPDDEHLPEYKEDEVESGKEYIPGQQDEDDFEKVIVEEFDLALRKFIVKINNKAVEPSREPEVDVSGLIDGSSTTAVKEHPKNPLKVAKGDTVLYTIRVYNEGDINGYVGEITDYLPEGLEFIENSEINSENGWENPSGDGKTITTRKLENTLLKAFNGEELDYADVQVECKVIAMNKASDLKNIAEITEHSDENGNKDIEDRDSTPDDLTDEQKENYNPEEPEKGKGYEDDDDFEDLVLQEFDLALRKFIVKINNKAVEPSREPEVDVSGLVDGSSTTAVKEHPKNPLKVAKGDTVLYTIRVYNEGDINGYVGEITDYLPEGLEFIENSEINNENGWENPSGDGKTITTRKLENRLLKAFNGEELDYADVQVECKVIAMNKSSDLKNIAEITEHSDEDGNKDIEDRDSTPDDLTDEQKENYNPEEPEKGKGYEDDDDFEDLVLDGEFDLALRKFITAVDDKEVTNRIPQFEIDEDGNYVYKHTKEPVEVENGNIVTYTLRIYNEGEVAGFAEQIKDDLPEGLLYLPENETNIEYRWKMIDENGEETENVEDAVAIVTDYLSKAQGEEAQRDNLLLAFDKETMEEPDHRDIKVAFLVTEPNTSDRILVNEAQISDDADENGDEVDDKDSTPDEWNEGEDDQDREYVKVKYFDLSLRKWVTQAILIVDGKQTVMDTGHKAEDDPEATVKVELVESKLSRTVLKFKYKIRITNEGEIAGSATEISDYIPKGLRFIQADNPKWKEVDGKVVTDQLKDVILQPGESTEVEIILTWINSKDNFGQMVNTAEISDDWNPSNTPDIDSTPNNEKPGEDDIDDAPVMPTIKTGSEPTYTILILGSLMIIGTGLVLIKKYVLN